MKKVLIAFDGAHFSEGAFSFARYMNEFEPLLLTGIFLPQVDYASLWSYADASGGPLLIPVMESQDADAINRNIERFKKACTDHNIEFRVHSEFYDFALPELKRETRFADLVILGSESFYSNLGTSAPNDYLKEALHAAECPVVAVPESFSFPQSNILAYDGSDSSVFAIKQFAYLFPQFRDNQTLLVTAKEEEPELKHDDACVKELVAAHFPQMTFKRLDASPEKYFATWISEQQSAILVSGAFGRSFFSQLFKRSFVSDVIRDHKLPVFITHR